MAGLNMRGAGMGREKKVPKELQDIKVAEAENGGHTAYHDFKSHPPEGPHIFPAKAEKTPVAEGSLFHHLAQHLNIPHEVMGKGGEKSPDEEQEEEEVE